MYMYKYITRSCMFGPRGRQVDMPALCRANGAVGARGCAREGGGRRAAFEVGWGCLEGLRCTCRVFSSSCRQSARGLARASLPGRGLASAPGASAIPRGALAQPQMRRTALSFLCSLGHPPPCAAQSPGAPSPNPKCGAPPFPSLGQPREPATLLAQLGAWHVPMFRPKARTCKAVKHHY